MLRDLFVRELLVGHLECVVEDIRCVRLEDRLLMSAEDAGGAEGGLNFGKRSKRWWAWSIEWQRRRRRYEQFDMIEGIEQIEMPEGNPTTGISKSRVLDVVPGRSNRSPAIAAQASSVIRIHTRAVGRSSGSSKRSLHNSYHATGTNCPRKERKCGNLSALQASFRPPPPVLSWSRGLV